MRLATVILKRTLLRIRTDTTVKEIIVEVKQKNSKKINVAAKNLDTMSVSNTQKYNKT